MLVLILATWTTNTGNAYMSGLAACKMFSIKDSKRPLVTMICGVLGVIMAIAGLADFLNTYISILGAVVPPIMGVVICDYWVICKAKKENWSPVRGINWIGIIAWVIGGGFALLETLGVVTVFSSALDGVIIAFAAYWILYRSCDWQLRPDRLAGRCCCHRHCHRCFRLALQSRLDHVRRRHGRQRCSARPASLLPA